MMALLRWKFRHGLCVAVICVSLAARSSTILFCWDVQRYLPFCAESREVSKLNFYVIMGINSKVKLIEARLKEVKLKPVLLDAIPLCRCRVKMTKESRCVLGRFFFALNSSSFSFALGCCGHDISRLRCSLSYNIANFGPQSRRN